MQNDLLKILAPQQLRGLPGHVLMGGAVSSVSANLVFLRDFAVQRVGCGFSRQPLEEGGIKHGNVRDVRQQLARHTDAGQMCRVVKRPERAELLDAIFHGIVDQCGTIEVLSALHHAVANGRNRTIGQARPDLLEQPEYALEANTVIGNRIVEFLGDLTVAVLDVPGFFSDALHKA